MSTKKSRLNNILDTYRILKGNARFLLFASRFGHFLCAVQFYLSLYMKELGVTDRQLFLISLGYMFSIFHLCSAA